MKKSGEKKETTVKKTPVTPTAPKEKSGNFGWLIIATVVMAILCILFLYATRDNVKAVENRLTLRIDNVELTSEKSVLGLQVLSSRIDTAEAGLSAMKTYVDVKSKLTADRVTAVESKIDTIEQRIAEIEANYKELSKVVWAHGSKANKFTKLIYQVAYQDDWKTGKKLYDKFQTFGKQTDWDTMLVKLEWDNVLKKLTPGQIQGILEINALEKRIVELENRKTSKESIREVDDRLKQVEAKLSKVKIVKKSTNPTNSQ